MKRVASMDELVISDEWQEWAVEYGVTADLDLQLEAFRSWHKANGKKRKDYAAAFKNWLIKTREWGQGAGGSGKSGRDGAGGREAILAATLGRSRRG